MAIKRKTLILGFGLALFMGVAVYVRIWAMDSSFTSDDREILRRQFERANMDAMDESAEWRTRYDEEHDKSERYKEELSKVKGAVTGVNERLSMLRKENDDLKKQVESLTKSVEANQQNCNCDNKTAES